MQNIGGILNGSGIQINGATIDHNTCIATPIRGCAAYIILCDGTGTLFAVTECPAFLIHLIGNTFAS
ncbi:MAG: hypothetical protein AAFR81_14255 [Chloroflexota bacterium]